MNKVLSFGWVASYEKPSADITNNSKIEVEDYGRPPHDARIGEHKIQIASDSECK